VLEAGSAVQLVGVRVMGRRRLPRPTCQCAYRGLTPLQWALLAVPGQFAAAPLYTL
jgi:hypothetical protein